MSKAVKRILTVLIAALIGAAIGTLFSLRHGSHSAARPGWLHFTLGMGISIALICLFSIGWDAAGKSSAPAQASESRSSRGFHLFVLNAGVLILILPLPGLSHRFLPASPLLTVAGLAIEIAGIAFAVWARRHLGRNWSGEVRIATGHELVRTGPYRHIRHPIYTGILAMYLGAMIVSGQWHALLGMAIIALAYARKLGLEEQILSASFGPVWQDWRRHSWALLPPFF